MLALGITGVMVRNKFYFLATSLHSEKNSKESTPL